LPNVEARLLEEDQADPDSDVQLHDQEEERVERRIGLGEQRMDTRCSKP
jgi:hypothetical protein